jgi:hypothetical protein
MNVEEDYDIGIGEGPGRWPALPGQRAASSARGKVVLALGLLVIAAGVVIYLGIYTRVRGAAEVKAETRELAVPSVSVARPKRGAPQEEIILPGNVQAFIEAPIYARTTGYLRRWYVDIGGRVNRSLENHRPLPLGGEGGPLSRCTSSGSGPGEGVRIIFIRLGAPQAHVHSE